MLPMVRTNGRRSSTSTASAWLSGLVLGVACGFLLIELGVVGLAFLALAVLLIVWKGPRMLAFGGLLTGFGCLWTVLLARVALTCGVDAFFPDANCATEDLTSWISGSAAIFVVGLGMSAVALRMLRR